MRNGRDTLEISPCSPTGEEVRSHLVTVLGSQAFRASHRCQQFLQYVVERALAGEAGCIKERTIGQDVFGLGPDFEPAQNAVVRVKANEVRKRLARFYEQEPPGDGVCIDLPVGSYIPEFTKRAAPPFPADRVALTPARPPAGMAAAPQSGESPSSRWLALMAVAILCFAAGLATAWVSRRSPGTAVDDLWSPFIDSGSGPVVFVPSLSGLSLAGWNNAQLAQTPPVRIDSFGHPIYSGNGHELELFDWIVGLGDAQAATAIAEFLASHNKHAVIKIGAEASFTDLTTHPSVLIGAFSSRWTLSMADELRFRFKHVPAGTNSVGAIVDTRDARRVWTAGRIQPNGRPNDDYGIAARLFDSKSGQPVVIAAGINTFGTHAAAEFLVTPSFYAQLLRRAPKDWKKRNFQAIVHSQVIGNTPGPPQLVDAYFW